MRIVTDASSRIVARALILGVTPNLTCEKTYSGSVVCGPMVTA